MLSRSLLFSYLGLFCIGLIDNSRGPIYPALLESFTLNTQSGSLIFSLTTLASFITTMLASFWQFHLSSLKATSIGLFLLGSGSLGFTLVSYFDFHFVLFLFFSIVAGVGIGVMSITLNVIVYENSDKLNRQKLFSGLHSMYGLASLLTPFIIGVIFELEIRWEYYFIFLALFTLSIMCIAPGSEKVKKSIRVKKLNISKKEILVLGLIISSYVSSEVLMSSRLVLFLQKKWLFSEKISSYFLGFFFLCLFSGRIFFSRFTLNIEKKKLLIISIVLSFVLCFLGIFTHPMFLSLSALTMSWFFPTFMGLISDIYQEQSEALIAKMMNFIGGMLFLTHFLFGQITELLNITYSFSLVFFFLAISLYLLHFKLNRYKS